MKDFVVSKAIALAIPIVLVLITLASTSTTVIGEWVFLIVMTVFFGHVHNLLSFKYQIKALYRKKNSKEIAAYVGLLFLSAGIVLYFIANQQEALLVPFVFALFFLHSYLNEQTILRFQAAISLPFSFFIFLTLVPLGLIYAALLHPSFYFDAQLVFYSLTEEQRLAYVMEQIVLHPKTVALAWLGLALVFLIQFLREVSGYVYLKVCSVALWVVSLALAWFVTIPYIYVYAISFMYHYILWSVVYFQKFYNEGSPRMAGYIREHLYIVLPLLVLIYAFFYGEGILHQIALFVFDIRVFFVTAFAHVVVSFLNEPWLQKYLV